MLELLSIPYFNCVFFFFPWVSLNAFWVGAIDFILKIEILLTLSDWVILCCSLECHWNEIPTDWLGLTENWLISIDCIRQIVHLFNKMHEILITNAPQVERRHYCWLFTKCFVQNLNVNKTKQQKSMQAMKKRTGNQTMQWLMMPIYEIFFVLLKYYGHWRYFDHTNWSKCLNELCCAWFFCSY